MFVFFLVGGRTLVRHTELRVEGAQLLDGSARVGALESADAVRRLGAAVVAVADAQQPSTLRFDAERERPFAERFGAVGLAVHVVLRASSVVDEPDLRGFGGENPPDRRLLARLPPDLAFAVSRRRLASAEDVARAVFESVPALLAEPHRAGFVAAANAEDARVRAVCAWYQVGHATPAAPRPDVLRREPLADASQAARFARLVGAMIDPHRREGGGPTSVDAHSVDRAALLCLDGAPLARLVATTLFGDGGCATSVAAWYASVLACAL
jgi:hypothetical protein